MNTKLLSGFMAALLIFSSCGKDKMTDQELIDAIRQATDKQVVSLGELPGKSQDVLTTDFAESYLQTALHAPSLGYEVEMRRVGGDEVGKRKEVYFDKKGKQLKGDDEDKEDKKGCFEKVFPLTLIMPDGTEITMNDGDDWTAIKAWYDANPSSEEKPTLQYPVGIVFDDGTTLTIENEEDWQRAYEVCEWE